jgi:hypothetical protein
MADCRESILSPRMRGKQVGERMLELAAEFAGMVPTDSAIAGGVAGKGVEGSDCAEV